MLQNGEVTELAVSQRTVADEIIENFMVAANVAMAEYLKGKGSLSIRRVVRIPKRWDGIQGMAAKFGVKLPALPDPRALAIFLDHEAADPDHFQDLSLWWSNCSARANISWSIPARKWKAILDWASMITTIPPRRTAAMPIW